MNTDKKYIIDYDREYTDVYEYTGKRPVDNEIIFDDFVSAKQQLEELVDRDIYNFKELKKHIRSILRM